MQGLTTKDISGDPSTSDAGEQATAGNVPVDEFEFSDISSTSCLLCARQFKSVEQLKRHNKESDLHKVRTTFHTLLLIIELGGLVEQLERYRPSRYSSPETS